MQELTTKMIQGNLAYYLSKHTPLTEKEVNEQFEEWLLAFVENIVEVRENQIIKELASNQHIWRERVTYDALIATIKGLQKGSQGWTTNPHYPSAHFTVFDDFDRKVFKLTATEWEKLNMELDKD